MRRVQFFVFNALMLCVVNCQSMDLNAPNVRVTDPDIIPFQKPAKKIIESIISEGTSDTFKNNMNKVDVLDYNDLEKLLIIINNRKKAISVVKEGRSVWDQVEQIRESIKKMQLAAEAPQATSKARLSFKPVFDDYIQQEETKLAEIEQVIETHKSQYSKEWFSDGRRIGYMVTKKSMNETKS